MRRTAQIGKSYYSLFATIDSTNSARPQSSTKGARELQVAVRIPPPTVSGLGLAVPTAHQYSGFAFPNEDGVRTGLGARSARQSNKSFKSGISDARSSSANNRAPSQGLCCTSHKSRLRDPPSATRHVPLCRSRVEIRPKLVERSKGNTRRTSRGYATRQTEQAVVGKAEVDWQSKLRSQDTMETVAERNTRTSSQA